ncbi:CAMK protein kinase [Phytophthora cinnamomi]|uniref:CAMK protein kinase n=1 Tax=Phytophthora cinnamomi TaxID=4785 RepID=UPI00355A5F1A|nr:CAMK protein kinase [Phytophthora cinnamomi]
MLRCLSCFSRRGALDDAVEDGRTTTSGILALAHHDKKTPAFEDAYDVLYQLGEGKTGQVFVAKHKRPHYRGRAKTLAEEQQREREERECDEEVAVKFVRQEYLSTPNRVEALESELAILARIKHPGVLRLREVFRDDDKFAIVTDKATGGEVMDAICRLGAPRVRECDVADIVRQLLSVLAYLHLNGITHRDVKVENILCKTQNLQDGVLLIDFGLAHMGTVGGNEMSGMNGTPHYMAPEMFHKHGYYGWAIDLWSLGVVTYVLLFGRFPFDARFLSQVEDKIVKGEFEYPKELESKVSHQAKKFIEYLLVLNPRERPPAAMALQHPWLQVDSSAADPFTDDHMAALAKFSEGKKTFAPPPAREHVPSQPAPPQGYVIYEE